MREFLTDRRLGRIRNVLAQRQQDLSLVIDNVHDPHNVAAILRSCDAFGVHRVHLYYTTDAYPALGRRSSASARKWVERTRHQDVDSLRAALEAQNMTLLATGFSDTAKPLTEWDLAKPTAIILSNEHGGVKPELAELAAGEIYIPMRGMVQSLNVSVAAAVILAEASRQRAAKGLYDTPSLSPQELAAWEEEWSQR